jgi:hypothetical protein
MNYTLQRTSMSLDQWTIKALAELAKRLGTSKAEIIRRAVRKAKEEADRESQQPSPLEALDWLQKGGGLTLQEADHFREEVKAERLAKKYWWES